MDVFDLYAKISLDSNDYDRSLQNAKNSADEWATKFVMAAKAVGSAVIGISGKIADVVGQSVNSYSQFQQLEGGIETLFGAGGKTFEQWNDAFTMSSESMNEYAEVAKKVINGDFGTGTERKGLLEAAGYDPETVQQMVNNLVNGIDAASNISAETIAANTKTAMDKYEALTRAQNNVMNNARNAWKTANMSANQYMTKATNYATALTQALGGDTEKAADVVDMAIQDMSDNVNKMGTSMDMVENAYRGFMMGNYRMLDNLHLGYQGTKEEMERLLADAEKFSGKKYNIDNLADVFEAVHVIQQELGIMNTTADESATTIEGSTKMMKAAWENVLTSMSLGGDWFDQSLKDLIDSIETWTENIMPVVSRSMEGVAELIENVVPLINNKLPGLIGRLLPSFTSAISSILDSILDAFPELLEVLNRALPFITEAINNLIPSIINFILESVPLLIEAGITLLTGLVSGMTDNVGTIVPQLTQGIIDMVDHISEIISSDGVGLASAGFALVGGLADAFVKAVPDVITQLTQLVQDLTANISSIAGGEDNSFLSCAVTILENLVDGLMTSIPTVVPELTSAVSEFISKFASLASENTTYLTNAAIDILNSLVTSLGDAGTIASVMTDLTTAVMAIIDAIINVITNLDVATFANACASIVGQLADGIVSAIDVITDKLPELITGIVAWLVNPENITGILDAAVTIGGTLISKVPDIIESLTSALWGIITGVAKYFTDNGDEVLKGFKDGFANVGTTISELWENDIKPEFEALGKHFIDWFTQFEWGQTLVDFAGKITSAFSDLWSKIKESFEGGEGLGAKIKNFFTNFNWGITFTVFVNNIKNSFLKLWDNVKEAFTGEENGLIGKIKSWFGEFDLKQIIEDFIQKIKDAIEGAWDSFKEWFQNKIGGLFSGIKVPNWIKKLFGKGEGNAEDVTTMDELDETLVDMPANMVTIDYSLLSPIPEDTLSSFQTFADIIKSINDMIAGGEGTLGLNTLLGGIPALLTNVKTSAEELGDYFSTGFVNAINNVIKHLAMSANDEEGNATAAGGNTLYTSMGWIFVLFNDIYVISQLIARYWNTEFIAASEKMRAESGLATGVLMGLAGVALGTAGAFDTMAASIWAAVGALMAYNMVAGAGTTRVPTTPVEGSGVGTVNVTFNGDVMGDEQGISKYVSDAVSAGIRDAVYQGSAA